MENYEKKGNVYFHINNGGININVLNNKYNDNEVPVLNINSRHFGIQTNDIRIPMTADDMEKLGHWLIHMSTDCKSWEKTEKCYIPTIENGMVIDILGKI